MLERLGSRPGDVKQVTYGEAVGVLQLACIVLVAATKLHVVPRSVFAFVRPVVMIAQLSPLRAT